MFESRIRKITTYWIEIDGERFKFRTLEKAIKYGKMIKKTGTKQEIKLIEHYRLWDHGVLSQKQIDEQEFDRSVLLN